MKLSLFKNKAFYTSLICLSLCWTVACQAGESEKTSASTHTHASKDSVNDKKSQETPHCRYSLQPDTIELEWTAYKFTDKTPVKGRFVEMQWSAAKPENKEGQADSKEASSEKTISAGTIVHSDLLELARGLTLQINPLLVETGNPARNATIKDYFFAQIAPQITAKLQSIEGDQQKGILKVDLTMNGQNQSIPLNYTVKQDGENSLKLVANGKLDFLQFGMQKSYEMIHEACKSLHTGPDGVAKTWSEVGLELQVPINRTCTP